MIDATAPLPKTGHPLDALLRLYDSWPRTLHGGGQEHPEVPPPWLPGASVLTGRRVAPPAPRPVRILYPIQQHLEITMPEALDPQWVRSPMDNASHRLSDREPRRAGTVEAICGHAMPAYVSGQTHTDPPNPHDICEVCRPQKDTRQVVPLPPVFAQERRRPVLAPRAMTATCSAEVAQAHASTRPDHNTFGRVGPQIAERTWQVLCTATAVEGADPPRCAVHLRPGAATVPPRDDDPYPRR